MCVYPWPGLSCFSSGDFILWSAENFLWHLGIQWRNSSTSVLCQCPLSSMAPDGWIPPVVQHPSRPGWGGSGWAREMTNAMAGMGLADHWRWPMPWLGWVWLATGDDQCHGWGTSSCPAPPVWVSGQELPSQPGAMAGPSSLSWRQQRWHCALEPAPAPLEQWEGELGAGMELAPLPPGFLAPLLASSSLTGLLYRGASARELLSLVCRTAPNLQWLERWWSFKGVKMVCEYRQNNRVAWIVLQTKKMNVNL